MNESDIDEQVAFKVWRQARLLIGDTSHPNIESFIHNCEAVLGGHLSIIRMEHDSAPAEIKLVRVHIEDQIFVLVHPDLNADSILDSFLRSMFYHLINPSRRKLDENPSMFRIKKDDQDEHLKEEYFVDVIKFYLKAKPGDLLSMIQAHATRKNFLKYLKALSKKQVLVLGSYSSIGLARIRAIEEALLKRNWMPQVVRDLIGLEENVALHKIRETVAQLSYNVEFVIIDDSEASGSLIELDDLVHNYRPTIVLRESGFGSTILTESMIRNVKTIRRFHYNNDTFDNVLDDAIAWVKSLE